VTGNGTPRFADGMRVTFDVSADGTYGVTVTAGPDVAFRLDHDSATAYAAACVATAMQADHQVAVLRLLTECLGLDFRDVAIVVKRYPRTNWIARNAVTDPVRFEPVVGRRTNRPEGAAEFEPLVAVTCNDTEVGCLNPDQAREHAESVLDALAAAQLDNDLFHYLTETIQVEPDRARGLIALLFHYMPVGEDREPEKEG